ncbi:MAG: S8 family serine peptidase, partial [Acidobacteriota bacterium]|nr:S8 family serine peptidase [Acidobacteriota bacterium]
MIFNKKYNHTVKTISFLLLFSLVLTNVFIYRAFAGTETKSSVEHSTLNKFSTDLTDLARNNQIKQNGNFGREVESLVKLLSGGGMQQPVILDKKGESQEIVVEQLAMRLASADVPASLKGKRLLKLELGSVFSQNEAEVSQTVEGIFNELAASNGDVILFVDELTNFVGNTQVNNSLTNLLLQGKLQIIGGSSQAAYKEKIDDNANISALFHPIVIGDAANGAADKNNRNSAAAANQEGFQGDNVASDLRDMMANDPTGKSRADVIIQAKDANSPALRSLMAQNGVRLNEQVGKSDTLVVNLPLSAINALAQSGTVNYMSPNRPVSILAGHLDTTTGAEAVRSQPWTSNRSAYTLDGTGIGVAIVDSGLYEAHQSFKNNGGASRIVFSKNFVTTSTTTDDQFGHGTHVAGIAAGNGTSSSGAKVGIAPNANIINLKVLDNNGRGQTAWLLNALQWLIDNNKTYNIRVANFSLGGIAVDSYMNDPICRKVEELSAQGVLVVAAAGNNGKNSLGQKIYGQIHSPGNDPSALTVGASNTKDTNWRGDDGVTTYSSRGPTRSFYTNANGVKIYDNATKPDLIAPGNRIISTEAPNGQLALLHPTLEVTKQDTPDNKSLMRMSGTSMATPVATGAAALLFQQNPKLTPNMVKMILEYTAQPLAGFNMLEQGAGELNLEGAVRLANAYRTGFDFNANATLGMSLMANPLAAFPTAQSTISGATFNWSQGILTNHTFLKGQAIANTFHSVYRNNSWFAKGICKGAYSPYTLNSNFANPALISLNSNIVTSNGVGLDTGSVFLAPGVLVSDGIIISDG